MDETVDLLDTRGRVIRLAISAAIGLMLAVLAFGAVRSVAVTPNPDALAKLGGIEMAGGMFLVFTAIVHAVLTKVARSRRT
jgi:xanthine/uracil/vitamin C permease (AzgA family)